MTMQIVGSPFRRPRRGKLGARRSSSPTSDWATTSSTQKIFGVILVLLSVIYIILFHRTWSVSLGSPADPSLPTQLEVGRFQPGDNERSILYGDSAGTERMLLEEAQRQRLLSDGDVDPEAERTRCQRFKLKYSGRKERRRIFYGGNIANDPWAALSALALEYNGIFHTVVFSESNTTPTLAPREWRFDKGSENLRLLQRIFGSTTRVFVDKYIQDGGWPHHFGFEGEQQRVILEGWRKRGMTERDIGLLGDPDELMMRDFVRAMQICDVKQFDDHNNCQDARISGAMYVSFEGGPQCRTSRSFRHPDMVIGQCIEGINTSPSLHPKVEREWAPPGLPKSQGVGWLSYGYTGASGFSKLPGNATHYPLFNAADFRRHSGHSYRPKFGYNAFHLHNFFSSPEVIRHKYLTYGEGRSGALTKAFGELDPDIQNMLDCVFNHSVQSTMYKLVPGGLDTLEGPIPIAFKVRGYVEARMKELREFLQLEKNIR